MSDPSHPFFESRLDHGGNPRSVKGTKNNVVLFTNRPGGPETRLRSTLRRMNVIVCSSFDDLLTLFETDAIDTLVFDASVSNQEMHYISGWARIFKPAVRCMHQLAHTLTGGVFAESNLSESVKSA